MEIERRYRVDRAETAGGVNRFVLIDEEDRLHLPATVWLGYLQDVGRSPNTVRDYGSRVAWYLSWTALTHDWRAIGVSHLAMWKRTVALSTFRRSNGVNSIRSTATVNLWMTPLRSFYEWADAHGELTSDVASRMTQMKYYAPGTPGGGEFGATRRVLVEELRASGPGNASDPEWIDDAGARERLELLDLNVRDRFLVDLLYFTGIRVGEALSLFTRDMHLGGGSLALGCRLLHPHLHVVLDNPVENGARSKGSTRVIPVADHLVERYIDYVLERQRVLHERDGSRHVFVNLYTPGERKGRAMTYSGVKALISRVGRKIDFPLSGPHMLRHTLATRLIRGIECEVQSADVVGELLGHRSEASTRIYTHDTERLKRAALSSIKPRAVRLGD